MSCAGSRLLRALVVGLATAASVYGTVLQAQPASQHEARFIGSRTPAKENRLARMGRLAYEMDTAAAAAPALAPATTPLLECFQFANSYGSPFVGDYTPPDIEFDRVVINFTVEVKGRQFDRWGTVYLDNVNIFSTSTAEPTQNGITWTWRKDVTPYLSLWREPQTLIFQLDNVITDIYTGLLNSTLTATFFKADLETEQPPADLILPVSAAKSPVTASFWTYPEENASVALNFPRNVNRAVFSANVKAQGNDEFWWSNVPQSAVNAFEPDVGVYWPYPTIFTGGVVPQLHRPIVGIDAFDLRDHEIDISPWLPLLCDGKEHTFGIQVVGLNDDGKMATLSNTTESSWYLVGKVFLWLDDEGSITTGVLGKAITEPTVGFQQSLSQNATGSNQTLDYTISVKRDFEISSALKTQKGNSTATWSQSLEYSNAGGLYLNGYGGINTFLITGKEAAKLTGRQYETSFSYPLFCNTTTQYLPAGNLTLWARLDQGLKIEMSGDGVFPTGAEAFKGAWVGSVLETERNGTANYSRYGDNTVTTGVGQTRQLFGFSGSDGKTTKELYFRDVSAFNNTVTANHEVVYT
ncbi:hypothetical protein CGMCC3_g17506 [Colletotrichum fructicola]|nr:uncharacterized protein CGMCC3_g17506 [Colletotrichum fructicola]KAE9566342.1 hypothetical protein CGMCC3_g17506 [Colletotrichum fructicola]